MKEIKNDLEKVENKSKEKVTVERVNNKSEIMKEKIITFVIGALVGSIITACIFLLVNGGRKPSFPSDMKFDGNGRPTFNKDDFNKDGNNTRRSGERRNSNTQSTEESNTNTQEKN